MRRLLASRRIPHAAAILLLTVFSLRATAHPHARHMARDQVLVIENQWVKAQTSGDDAAMEKLLAPDFLGITAAGEAITREQQLDRMRGRQIVVNKLDISDVKVKLIGQHVAIVTSLAQLDGTSDGHPLTGSFRYTHVYQRTAGGGWTITNFEATRIPHSGRDTMSAAPVSTPRNR